ncbi:unnamed protein product [Gulo gulo]|uniref:Uncharacterized protein n=1 Tax=Gulo gulo TaxID=48420 RepID=A0A9X9M0M3_GULGU|nr:unnamed protein product [Gulo gulo]
MSVQNPTVPGQLLHTVPPVTLTTTLGGSDQLKKETTLPHPSTCFYPEKLWRAQLCGQSRRTPRTT